MILSSLIEESFQRNQRSLEEGALKNSLLGAGLGATALGAAGIYDDVHMDNLEHTSQIHNALHDKSNGIYDNNGKIDNSALNKWNTNQQDQRFKKPEELKQFAQQNEKDFNANKDEINKAKPDHFQSHYDHLKNWINDDDKVGKHTAMYGAAAIGGGATLGAILGRRR